MFLSIKEERCKELVNMQHVTRSEVLLTLHWGKGESEELYHLLFLFIGLLMLQFTHFPHNPFRLCKKPSTTLPVYWIPLLCSNNGKPIWLWTRLGSSYSFLIDPSLPSHRVVITFLFVSGVELPFPTTETLRSSVVHERLVSHFASHFDITPRLK